MKKIFLLGIGMLAVGMTAHSQNINDDAAQRFVIGQYNQSGLLAQNTTVPSFNQRTQLYAAAADPSLSFTFSNSPIDRFAESKYAQEVIALPPLPSNTHYGTSTMVTLSGAENNSAFGYNAMNSIMTGNYNTSVGSLSLQSIIQGSGNTAIGYNAINEAFKASSNTAVGSNALFEAMSASGNTALGYYAMGKGSVTIGYNDNVAVGNNALNVTAVGSGNTCVGAFSGPLDGGAAIHGSTALGRSTVLTASYQVRIGHTNVTSIGGIVSWSTLSDGRFKQDVKEDVSGLNFIKGLRPVSYQLDRASVKQFLGVKDQEDESREAKIAPVRQTGFIAQEVDKLVTTSGYVFNGIDAPKNDKDLYSIRYSEFVVPLVKAVQELSAIVETQQATIEKLLAKSEEGDGVKKVGSTRTLLLQNTPNPFTSSTEIKMVLPDNALNASVIVYNLEGKQLKEIRVTQRGDASVAIGASELSAGMYLYTLIVDGAVVDTKRMVLTK